MCDSLAIDGMRSGLNATYTPYVGIYKVEAGCYLCATLRGTKSTRYWSPYQNNNLPKYTNARDAADYMKELLLSSIKDYMVLEGKKGATLSGGLDSATVCGMASSVLKATQEELLTYTFVPVKEFQFSGEDYYIADEAENVRSIAAMHGNIQTSFLDTADRNAYEELDGLLDILEVPLKSACTLPVIYNCYGKAYRDGCKLILTGQYGNMTISQGNFNDVAYDYIKKLDMKSFMKLINGCHLRYHTSRRKMIGYMMRFFMKCFWNNGKYFCSRNLTENTLIKYDCVRRWNILRKLKKADFNQQGTSACDRKSYRKGMYDPILLAQIGEMGTKVGLYHGIIERDPAKDIRVIEYCVSLPMECFFQAGLDRWLIRGNMEQYIPHNILLDMFHRGYQCADFVFNLKPEWNAIMKEMSELPDSPLGNYLDMDKLAILINGCRDGIEDGDIGAAYQIFYLLSWKRLIRSNNGNMG